MLTRILPFEVGPVHFVGVGGIGMSGIAEVMAKLGYTVQGSDAKDGPNLDRLRAKGVRCFVGHDGAHVADADVVVISSAIKAGNPEVDAARARGVPVVRRAEMLAELMRLQWTIAIGGTHGKTTTTSLMAALLDGAGFDPTVINGGIINAYGSNARVGEGKWMVVEADESDGTFTKLRPMVALVTNMDPEHLDHYGSVEAMKAGFEQFVTSVPFYGFAVLCLDHPEVQALASRVPDRRIVTYGFNPQADVRGVDLAPEPGGTRFALEVRKRSEAGTRRIDDLFLPMAGRHNVQNAVGALAAALEIGASEEGLRRGLAGFAGVKRRFTSVGEWNGVRIIDDYGHHPVEIAAVLKAARDTAPTRVLAVVQPHRYTRLRDLFNDFATCCNEADVVAIAPVYAAGEAPIEGISHESLVGALRAAGHKDAVALSSLDALPDWARAVARPGDVLVCLGAGDITTHANGLAEALSAS
jgi:UDP-N-acetylmuramate--alanine ligase